MADDGSPGSSRAASFPNSRCIVPLTVEVGVSWLPFSYQLVAYVSTVTGVDVS